MKDAEYISELGPENFIHSGQVFAEMLGAACHPEFFNNIDVEVNTTFLSPYTSPLIPPPFRVLFLLSRFPTSHSSPSVPP